MAFHRKEQITFLLTSACNLECSYCYMPKLNGTLGRQTLDLEFAKLGLRDFFATSASRTIRFFAPGEPTLAFQEMQEIWRYASDMAGSSLITELETNGFFDEEIAAWIQGHVDYLWISCDGPPAVQDAQRMTLAGGKTSNVVLDNIRRAVKTGPRQVGVRATVGPAWLDRQIELVEYFHQLGVQHLAASPWYSSSQNPSVATPSLLDFAKGFVPAFYRARELGMWYLTLMIVNFDEPVEYYCQASIPTPRLTTDGYVSCCDWAAFGAATSVGDRGHELIYGRYLKEENRITYDRQRIERLRKRCVAFLGDTYCNGCCALHHCAGGCLGKVMAATGDLYRPMTDWCEAVRYLFARLPVDTGRYPIFHP